MNLFETVEAVETAVVPAATIVAVDELDFVVDIQTNNSAGASVLLQKALTGLAQWVEAATEEIFVSDFDVLLLRLIKAQPAMAPFVNLRRILRQALMPEQLVTPFQIKDVLHRINTFLETDRHNMIVYGAEFINDGETYLTVSNSQAVRDTFLAAKSAGKIFKVICTESRPTNEGVRLAETLHYAGIKTTLIVDAAVYAHTRRCSGIFVGADFITRDGWGNKIGTSAVCLAAHDFGIPVWCCAEQIKVTKSRQFQFRPAKKPPEEVYSGIVPVSNIYFEKMPLDWLSGLITGIGVIPAPIELGLEALMSNLSLEPAKPTA